MSRWQGKLTMSKLRNQLFRFILKFPHHDTERNCYLLFKKTRT